MQCAMLEQRARKASRLSTMLLFTSQYRWGWQKGVRTRFTSDIWYKSRQLQNFNKLLSNLKNELGHCDSTCFIPPSHPYLSLAWSKIKLRLVKFLGKGSTTHILWSLLMSFNENLNPAPFNPKISHPKLALLTSHEFNSLIRNICVYFVYFAQHTDMKIIPSQETLTQTKRHC